MDILYIHGDSSCRDNRHVLFIHLSCDFQIKAIHRDCWNGSEIHINRNSQKVCTGINGTKRMMMRMVKVKGGSEKMKEEET